VSAFLTEMGLVPINGLPIPGTTDKVPPPRSIPKELRGKWGWSDGRLTACLKDGVIRVRTGKKPSPAEECLLNVACPDGKLYAPVFRNVDTAELEAHLRRTTQRVPEMEEC